MSAKGEWKARTLDEEEVLSQAHEGGFFFFPFFLAESHCGTWAKEVLLTMLKRYFSKIWCFTDHSQCCQFYRWPTSAFQIVASEDSSTCILKAEDPAVGKGTIRVSKPEVTATTHMRVGASKIIRSDSFGMKLK